MEMRVRFRAVETRVEGLFVRLAASSDAKANPRYHRLDLVEGKVVRVVWTSIAVSAETLLVWEACGPCRAPEAEGGDLEPEIVGGAVTRTCGAQRIVLRDFYAETREVVGILEVELSGLPEGGSLEKSAEIEALHRRYDAYYDRVRPTYRRGPRMTVPTFSFYGAHVPASYLALMSAGMDDAFAASLLHIVLEDAGMSGSEFARVVDAQFASSRYLQATTAAVARLGEFVTLTANLLRYRADMSSPALDTRRLIEKIVPHAREEGAGDCEDLALEIYFCFSALKNRFAEPRNANLARLWRLSKQYVPFLATGVATSPSAKGGGDRGSQLHVYALALSVRSVRVRLPRAYRTLLPPPPIAHSEGYFPNLVPLEPTNWVDALHLPKSAYYGADARDARAQRTVERLETEAARLAPEIANWPTRMRQSLDGNTSLEGFSFFYREVTELWGDFSASGSCCFSPITRDGTYGVPLGTLAEGGAYDLAPVFEHSPEELAAVKRAMRTTMPVPPHSGKIRAFRVASLERGASVRPQKASRLFSDAIVYRFRSLARVESPEVQKALDKLERGGFRIDYRAWALPPDGARKYIAVYAQK